MKLTDELMDELLSNCRGGYVNMDWTVCERDGSKAKDAVVKPGRFICAENPNTYIVLYVCDDMSLVQATRDWGN